MKTLILIATLLLMAAPFSRGAEPPQAAPAKSNPKTKNEPKPPGQTARSLDDEITAIRNKHPILQDAASVARERKFHEATAQLNADPEIQKLREELGKAFYTAGGPRKVDEANQALLKREREKVPAVHPDLKEYVDARLAYRREIGELMGRHASDPAAREKIKQHFK